MGQPLPEDRCVRDARAGSQTVSLPTGTAAGTWYILARADATGAVAESTETNNVTSKVITITP